MDLDGLNFYFVHISPNARIEDRQLTSTLLIPVTFTMANMHDMIQEVWGAAKAVMRYINFVKTDSSEHYGLSYLLGGYIFLPDYLENPPDHVAY